MVQVIQRQPEQESFGSLFGRNLGQGISQGFTSSQEAARKLKGEEASDARKFGNEEKLAKLKGEQDLTRLEREYGLKGQQALELMEHEYGFKKEIAQINAEQQQLKFKNKILEHQEKTKEKIKPIQSALKTVEKMREIRSRGNLGFGVGFTSKFGGEDARDAGEYKQLGKSLIALSSTIPIRNREEFKTLAEGLYDPSITDAEAAGTLDAMEHILSVGLEENDSEIEREVIDDFHNIFGEDEELPEEKPSSRKRPSLTTFHR
jgi:hypothetical protein